MIGTEGARLLWE